LQTLNHQITLGWFIRALHGWGSSFMLSDVVAAWIQAFQRISRKLTEMYPGYSTGAQPYLVDADWLECG
jgi:hypothetical protein